jgi:protein-L-isoaspartate O-methyltransferase
MPSQSSFIVFLMGRWKKDLGENKSWRTDQTEARSSRGRTITMIDDNAPLATHLSHSSEQPLEAVRSANLLFLEGQREQAIDLCMRAIAVAPDHPEVRTYASRIISDDIPIRMFSNVRDQVRNLAYESALRRAIQPGCRVLEIGTGTGLFAMMAARAGAAEVVTCEKKPSVAATASEIVASNGFADRVRVIAKSSFDLKLGVDLKEPVDVILWDLVRNDIVGDGALAVIEHAVRRLAKPGARVIPASGSIRVALVNGRRSKRHPRMSIVDGFNLSPFNRLAPPWRLTMGGVEKLGPCSEPVDLFHFDFRSGGPFPDARTSVSLSASGERVNGVVQWVRLKMDDTTWYEPLHRDSAFLVRVCPLGRSIKVLSGTTMTVHGAYDRKSLYIWTEGPSNALQLPLRKGGRAAKSIRLLLKLLKGG